MKLKGQAIDMAKQQPINQYGLSWKEFSSFGSSNIEMHGIRLITTVATFSGHESRADSRKSSEPMAGCPAGATPKTGFSRSSGTVIMHPNAPKGGAKGA